LGAAKTLICAVRKRKRKRKKKKKKKSTGVSPRRN